MAAATIVRPDTVAAGAARPGWPAARLRAPVPAARAAGDRGGAARRRHATRRRHRPRVPRPDGRAARASRVQTVRMSRRLAGPSADAVPAARPRAGQGVAGARPHPGPGRPGRAGPWRCHGRAPSRSRPASATAWCGSSPATGRGRGFWRSTLLRRVRGVLWQIGLASVVINLLALATPLFMMTVYNKVINHAALQTLDVLAIGMVTLVAFELLLRALRGYITAHTGATAGGRDRQRRGAPSPAAALSLLRGDARAPPCWSGCARSTSCASS